MGRRKSFEGLWEERKKIYRDAEKDGKIPINLSEPDEVVVAGTNLWNILEGLEEADEESMKSFFSTYLLCAFEFVKEGKRGELEKVEKEVYDANVSPGMGDEYVLRFRKGSLAKQASSLLYAVCKVLSIKFYNVILINSSLEIKFRHWKRDLAKDSVKELKKLREDVLKVGSRENDKMDNLMDGYEEIMRPIVAGAEDENNNIFLHNAAFLDEIGKYEDDENKLKEMRTWIIKWHMIQVLPIVEWEVEQFRKGKRDQKRPEAPEVFWT